MKKITLLLGLLLLANSAAFASCDNYECVAPYDMNSKFRTIVGAETGVNTFTEIAVEKIIKKEVLKIGSADNLKIDLDSYSAKDLKNGIFKSMSVNAQNVVINDIYLTSLSLKTLCNFNYIKKSGDDIVFMEALPMSFDIKMNQSSINKTMQNEKYQKVIKDFNKLSNSYGVGLQISSTKVAIKNNKFYYIIGFEVPFVRNEYKIVLETDLKVKNGKIDFNNTKLVSGHMNMDLKKIDFILNYLNPLDFSVHILDNKDAKVNVQNIEIKNNTIETSGVVVIPKD